MKLIVGSNSLLVRKLNLSSEYVLCSHKNIDQIDFDIFKEILIFSYSKNLKENLSFLKKFPIKKVVYVSSIAVLSELIRNQPFSYPRVKSLSEDLIIKNGGRIVRLGFSKFGDIPTGWRYPHTSIKMLEKYIFSDSKPKIKNLYKLKKSGPRTRITFLDFLEDVDLFYFLISSLKKIFNIKPYGYTRDSLKLFNGTFLIGSGVLGKRCFRDFSSEINFCLTSQEENINLNENGFKNTIVGKSKDGLSKLWHSIFINKENNLFYRRFAKKKYFLAAPKNKHISFNVEKLNFSKNNLELVSNKYSIHPEKIILAAGPFENVRLLSSDHKKFVGSDHEVYFYGQIPWEELSNKNFIKKIGPFFIKGPLLTNIKNLLVDFRPGFRELNKPNISGNFYTLNTKFFIFKKILFSLDFERLNEAMFNRFGIGVATKKVSIFIQELNVNSIEIECAENKVLSLKRKRFSRDHLLSDKKILEGINGIGKNSDVFSLDSQHTVFSDDINNLNQKIFNNIFILGSPTDFKLNAFHHSMDLYDFQKENLNIFLKKDK